MRGVDLKLAGLVVVGVLALVAGGLATYTAVRPSADAGTSDDVAVQVHTKRFVSKAGGFRIRVPHGMHVTRNGGTARFTARDRSMVVAVGPSSRGRLRAASRDLLRTVRAGYRNVEVLGHQRDRIGGRPALSTSGLARNDKGTRLRFVVTLVRARPENYAVTAFVAADADPALVLPRLNKLAGSLRLLR